MLHLGFHAGILQEFRQEGRHLDAIPGQFDCRLKQFGPGQFSVPSVKGLVASQLSGNADPLAACRRQTGSLVPTSTFN